MSSEKELINACIKKDPQAWEKIYRLYSPTMYAVCMRYVKNREDAMDLLHDGFITVFSNINSFRFTGSFEGWIRRIMVHTAINFYNRHVTRKDCSDDTLADTLENDCPDVVSEMSASELLEHVQALPDGYRMVFNLYVIEGFKHEEIAQMLGISENTSKSQLMKARRLLMKTINTKVYETT